jgi:hypothetical protein
MSSGNGTVPTSGNIARMITNAYLIEAGHKPIPAERWREYPALANAIRNRKRDDDDQS